MPNPAGPACVAPISEASAYKMKSFLLESSVIGQTRKNGTEVLDSAKQQLVAPAASAQPISAWSAKGSESGRRDLIKYLVPFRL